MIIMENNMCESDTASLYCVPMDVVTNITLHLRPIFSYYFTTIQPTQRRYKVVWKKMMSANWSHLKMLCFHFSKKMCQMDNILYVQADLEAVKL